MTPLYFFIPKSNGRVRFLSYLTHRILTRRATNKTIKVGYNRATVTAIFEKNIEAWNKRYPNRKITSSPAERYVTKESHCLELFDGNQLIDSLDPHFFHGIKNLSDQHHPENSHLMLLGFGIGGLYQKAKITYPHTKSIYVIEPSLDLFIKALEMSDYSKDIEDAKIHWWIGYRKAELFEVFFHHLSNSEALINSKPLIEITHPIIDKLFPSYFKFALAQWEAVQSLATNIQSFAADGFEGLKNTIGNISWIKETPGIHALRGLFKGLPGIVISTGPSLTKSLPLLKELQNKAILLSADASLEILLKAGIVPHFVFCLERDEGSKPFFQNIPKEQAKPYLVTFPIVPNTVIQAYPGKSFCTYRNYGYYAFFEEISPKGMMRCGPSVAHMALSAGAWMGCDPLILVGQDLAFDPKTLATHPAGISYKEWAEENSLESLKLKLEKQNDQLLWVEGNLSNQVPTSGLYEVFRQVFAEHTHALSATVWNATEGGAKIPGIRWKSLSELSQTFHELPDIWKKIEQCRLISYRSDPEKAVIHLSERLSVYEMALERALQIESADSLLKEKELIQMDPLFAGLVFHFFGKDRIEMEWKLRESVNAPLKSEIHRWFQRCLDIVSEFRKHLLAAPHITLQSSKEENIRSA